MKETKFYCDICHTELTPINAKIGYIRLYSEQREREIHLCAEHYEALKPKTGDA